MASRTPKNLCSASGKAQLSGAFQVSIVNNFEECSFQLYAVCQTPLRDGSVGEFLVGDNTLKAVLKRRMSLETRYNAAALGLTKKLARRIQHALKEEVMKVKSGAVSPRDYPYARLAMKITYVPAIA